MNQLTHLSNKFFNALKPPPKLTLSQWADSFAYLSAVSAAEPGKWKTLPYQRGMMDAMTDPRIEQVTVMKSARVGYTKCVNWLIAFHIHQDPCSILFCQPTIEDAEGYSKEEIAPMLEDTPVLRGLVSEAKSKDGSNTILAKNYPGGTLGIVGANSARGFRRVSRRIAIFDETDGYPVGGAGSEGDPIKLGIKRTEYFWNRKIVAGSTPTVEDFSRIEKLFKQGDQRHFFVPCPECDHPQYLKFPNMKWPDGEPHLAYFLCEKNECVIPHSKKRWIIEEADRRALADPSSAYGWKATAPGNGKHASFHIWAAYSFSPNATWGNLAEEFLECKGDRQALQTFVNTALGEVWKEDQMARLGAEGLAARVESYKPNTIPKGGLVIVGACDVQDNRFAVSLYAFGRGEERWLIFHQEIFGDPSKPEIWKQLDDILFRKYPTEDGHEMQVSAFAIDSGGHYTMEVYQYVRDRRGRRADGTSVLAIKGQSQKRKPAIGKPTMVDVNYKGMAVKSGAELYPVGVDTIKSAIYGHLKIVQPGPNCVHFHSELTLDFFEQLTSEKKVVRYLRNGTSETEWVKKPGTRNESWDTAVYSYAAMQYLYTRFNRNTIWDQFEKKLGRKKADQVEIKPAVVVEEKLAETEAQKDKPAEQRLKEQTRDRRINHNRRSGGFVSSW
jgi:terminase, large subunit